MRTCRDSCSTHRYPILYLDLVEHRLVEYSPGDGDRLMQHRAPADFVPVPTAHLPCRADLAAVLRDCLEHARFDPNDMRVYRMLQSLAAI